MSYQVLARKWRPRSFAEMVGQEHVLKALVHALEQQRLHHAYLFTGTRGVGKTTLGRILARCLNCEQGISAQPCGTCAACTEIGEGRYVDLIEVDAASQTKVEQTRELLENAQYAPTRGRFKVYLVDEVHMLSKSSFNALLKTLEEPPPHVKFLLATTDPQKLPVTVLSRCLQFNLKNLTPDLITARLREVLEAESIEFESGALERLARAAAGSMRDALSLADQAVGYGNGRVIETDVCAMLGTIERDHAVRILEALLAGDGAALLDVVAELASRTPDFPGLLEELLTLLHRVAVLQAVPGYTGDGFLADAAERDLAARIAPEDLQLFYQVGLHGRRDLPFAPDPRAGLEMTLLRMLSFLPVSGPGGMARVAPSGQSNAVSGSEPPQTRPAPEPEPAAVMEAVGGDPEVDAKKKTEAGLKLPSAVPPGAPENLDAEAWIRLLPELELPGIAARIAAHCVPAESGPDSVHFILEREHATLYSEDHRDAIRAALAAVFGAPVAVRIEPGDPVAESPAARSERLRVERMQAAVAELEGDGTVRALQEKLGGRIRLESVKPID